MNLADSITTLVELTNRNNGHVPEHIAYILQAGKEHHIKPYVKDKIEESVEATVKLALYGSRPDNS